MEVCDRNCVGRFWNGLSVLEGFGCVGGVMLFCIWYYVCVFVLSVGFGDCLGGGFGIFCLYGSG